MSVQAKVEEAKIVSGVIRTHVFEALYELAPAILRLARSPTTTEESLKLVFRQRAAEEFEAIEPLGDLKGDELKKACGFKL